MTDKELVLELGVEGGGATVFRTLLPSGGWQFHVEGSSMYLDEHDDEGWRSWASQPVRSLEEALRSVAGDGSWVLFHPITVHSYYRAPLWDLAQSTARDLSEDYQIVWERRRAAWESPRHVDERDQTA